MIRHRFSSIFLLMCFIFVYKLFCWNSLLFNNNVLFFFMKIFIISGFLLSIYLLFIASTRLSLFFGYMLCLLFPISLLLYIYVKNIYIYLFFYEFFVFPSALLVFFFSPNIRFIAAHLYFLLWTQFGSFLVVLGVLLLTFDFGPVLSEASLPWLSNIISLLILFGFGVKVPIWPFHFWLTKTHVEAPTFFSIYLSGFLVKTALLGLLLFANFFPTNIVQLFIIISLIGVIDSTLKLIVQVDLKKFVAYTTVQEMNLILLLVLYSGLFDFVLVGGFILTHTLLSTLFFYLVDVLYKKYRGRTTNLVYGVWHSDIMLGSVIYISMMLYMGLPYTTKFFIEIYLFFSLFALDPVSCLIIIIVVNCIGSIFFGKIWFNVLFNVNLVNYFTTLRKKQLVFFLFYFSCFILFLFISMFI